MQRRNVEVSQSEIRLGQMMCIYITILPNFIRILFKMMKPDVFWSQFPPTTTRTTRWVAVWAQFLI